VIETPRKKASAIHMAARSPQRRAASRAIGSTERLWPACWFDISIAKTSVLARRPNSATSLKQAVFGQLREF
jgi:hypothetical protein